MALSTTSLVLGAVGLLVVLLMLYLLARCLTQGKTCPNRERIDAKTVLITDADTTIGIGIVKCMNMRQSLFSKLNLIQFLGQSLTLDLSLSSY